MFDIFEAFMDWDNFIINFDPSEIKFNDQMAQLGYETYNSIMNLSSLSFLLFFYFLRVCFMLIWWIFIKITGKEKPEA